jgi:hypothetical protein
MSEWWHNYMTVLIQDILIIGALVTAIGVGLKRVYKMARSVEKILEFNISEKEARERVAADLLAHIRSEELREKEVDQQLAEMASTIREIGREVRPNGGSSMKDVLNHTAERVGDIQTRVAVLEEWKRHADRS